uniref:Uncharacterized protein n=1 Tax=Marseillevirus LCMAC201 TaxID=2506605 RepID=A0A481YY15_9VIRU|nr:MAG: hypothetical protein LCMAC201_02660 [Marseillevirus LCMAC201]
MELEIYNEELWINRKKHVMDTITSLGYKYTIKPEYK